MDMSEVTRPRLGPQRMTAVGSYSCVTEAKQRWPFRVQVRDGKNCRWTQFFSHEFLVLHSYQSPLLSGA